MLRNLNQTELFKITCLNLVDLKKLSFFNCKLSLRNFERLILNGSYLSGVKEWVFDNCEMNNSVYALLFNNAKSSVGKALSLTVSSQNVN